MKDCLVETFKKGQNDESLPLFDGFEVEVDPGSMVFWTKLPNGVIVTWDNDVDTITLGSLTVHSPYTHIYAGAEGEYWHATLTKKTKFTFRKALYVNEKFLYTKVNSPKIVLGKNYLKSMFKYGVLKDLYGYSPLDAEGETIDIADTISQQLYRFFVYNGSNLFIQGNIRDFNHQTSCIEFGCFGQGVEGSLEELIEGLCTAGKVDGNVNTDFRNTKVTFNGARLTITQYPLTGFIVTFSSAGATVSYNDTLLATYTKSNHTWTYES